MKKRVLVFILVVAMVVGVCVGVAGATTIEDGVEYISSDGEVSDRAVFVNTYITPEENIITQLFNVP